MLRRRSALAGVFLCFLCLLAVSETRPPRCSEDIATRVSKLIHDAPKKSWLNCSLYTPNITDYEQKCPSTTLRCFADELKVLCEEWEVSNRNSRRNLNAMLRTLASKFNQTETDCLQCELLEEQSAETFLKKLSETIHVNNMKFC